MNIFEKAVSVDALEHGIWEQPDLPTDDGSIVPFTNTIGDEVLPVRLRIRSKASQAYRDEEISRNRKNAGTMFGGGNKRRSQAKLVDDTTKDKRALDFAVLVTGMENVDTKGVITPSRDELLAFCADFDKTKGWVVRTGMIWLVDWVISIAEEDGKYGASAGNAPPPLT